MRARAAAPIAPCIEGRGAAAMTLDRLTESPAGMATRSILESTPDRLENTMHKLAAPLVLLLVCASAHSQDADTLRQLADRAAIHEVMQQYVWSVDSLDADGYVAVFTPDAEIDSNGKLSKGHDAIRKIVTDLKARQDANRARGEPPGAFYHVISNERISLTSATEALYQSYWQTMRKNEEGRYTAGGFGRSEDRLVKANGRWLIKSRKLFVFTD